MQEKKVKKIAEMNIHASENGSIASSSSSTSTSYLPNGACAEIPHNHLSNDLSYPSGGSASLRLPVVVVLNYAYYIQSMIWNLDA